MPNIAITGTRNRAPGHIRDVNASARPLPIPARSTLGPGCVRNRASEYSMSVVPKTKKSLCKNHLCIINNNRIKREKPTPCGCPQRTANVPKSSHQQGTVANTRTHLHDDHPERIHAQQLIQNCHNQGIASGSNGDSLYGFRVLEDSLSRLIPIVQECEGERLVRPCIGIRRLSNQSGVGVVPRRISKHPSQTQRR